MHADKEQSQITVKLSIKMRGGGIIYIYSSVYNEVTAPEKAKMYRGIIEVNSVLSIQHNITEVKGKWFGI